MIYRSSSATICLGVSDAGSVAAGPSSVAMAPSSAESGPGTIAWDASSLFVKLELGDRNFHDYSLNSSLPIPER
jgi:hypothetical protein